MRPPQLQAGRVQITGVLVPSIPCPREVPGGVAFLIGRPGRAPTASSARLSSVSRAATFAAPQHPQRPRACVLVTFSTPGTGGHVDESATSLVPCASVGLRGRRTTVANRPSCGERRREGARTVLPALWPRPQRNRCQEQNAALARRGGGTRGHLPPVDGVGCRPQPPRRRRNRCTLRSHQERPCRNSRRLAGLPRPPCASAGAIRRPGADRWRFVEDRQPAGEHRTRPRRRRPDSEPRRVGRTTRCPTSSGCPGAARGRRRTAERNLRTCSGRFRPCVGGCRDRTSEVGHSIRPCPRRLARWRPQPHPLRPFLGLGHPATGCRGCRGCRPNRYRGRPRRSRNPLAARARGGRRHGGREWG